MCRHLMRPCLPHSMMTNIVDCDPGALKIGDRVRLVFRIAEDGTSVPMFAPA